MALLALPLLGGGLGHSWRVVGAAAAVEMNIHGCDMNVDVDHQPSSALMLAVPTTARFMSAWPSPISAWSA